MKNCVNGRLINLPQNNLNLFFLFHKYFQVRSKFLIFFLQKIARFFHSQMENFRFAESSRFR